MTTPPEQPPPGFGPPPPPGFGPPPGYGPGGFGSPPPGYGYPQPVGRTNVLAILAVVAIFFFTPAALVLGLIARSQIRRTGEGGDGLALAGIIVGTLSIVLVGLMMIFVFSVFFSVS